MVKSYLIGMTKVLHNQDVRARWETQFGLVVENILDAAQRRAVNLIVRSTHGRAGIRCWIVGSVAACVLHTSHILELSTRSTYPSSK